VNLGGSSFVKSTSVSYAMIEDERDVLLVTKARSSGFKAIEKLLNQGADPLFVYNGTTALHEACAGGDAAVVALLIHRGASINPVDRHGKRPLHHSVTGGYNAVVSLLIAHGADLNVKDMYGNTPLHQAARHGSLSVIETLLSNGASVNSTNSSGDTPGHCAARVGNHRAVQALLENVREESESELETLLYARNLRGQTILDCASGRPHAEKCVHVIANMKQWLADEATSSFSDASKSPAQSPFGRGNSALNSQDSPENSRTSSLSNSKRSWIGENLLGFDSLFNSSDFESEYVKGCESPSLSRARSNGTPRQSCGTPRTPGLFSKQISRKAFESSSFSSFSFSSSGSKTGSQSLEQFRPKVPQSPFKSWNTKS